ncbi:MAG: TPM domain-containing protein [Nevskia sp.]|nr:TPM domain-containing protein [Nevskia sp.]
MSRWQRLWRHLFVTHGSVRRCFPQASLDRIEREIAACEERHAGEIRFAVEAALHPAQLWHGLSARQRAIEVFSLLRVWDTEHNNGVLIYLLLADRSVEIVADRGVAGGRVAEGEWEAACALMRKYFAEGEFEDGVVAGIEAVADVLARYPPGAPRGANELPNTPVIL